MRKLLAVDLAGMLIFGGFMPAEAQDDPEGFDNYRTMEKVGYLADLINASMSATEPASAADVQPEALNPDAQNNIGAVEQHEPRGTDEKEKP